MFEVFTLWYVLQNAENENVYHFELNRLCILFEIIWLNLTRYLTHPIHNDLTQHEYVGADPYIT